MYGTEVGEVIGKIRKGKQTIIKQTTQTDTCLCRILFFSLTTFLSVQF